VLVPTDNSISNVGEVGEELPMTPSSQTDAERFRKEAEECRELAEKAMSPLDKEAWVRLAEDWLKLAQEAERSTRFGRMG
jgi:hypothetical protein